MAAFPDSEARRLIERCSAAVEDPAERLGFVLRAARVVVEGASAGSRGKLWGRLGRRIARLKAIRRVSPRIAKSFRFEDRALLALPVYQGASLRWKFMLAAVGLFVLSARPADVATHEPEITPPPSEPLVIPAVSRQPRAQKLDVWLVENQGQTELYSNGLIISNEWLRHTGPRSYAVYSRGPGTESVEVDRRDRPMGLVFHTTESDLPALERKNNQSICYERRKLLAYIRKEKLYHFVIDRFGQVCRIIPETEHAYHAGYSLWADGGEFYINLNQSFIGISFETRPGGVGPDLPPQEGVTEAQFSSARLLTEMLRDRFGILESNCVTHEMISVNPNKMLVGYHVDWRGRFPFQRVGLPDNYEATLASVAEWGCRYDSRFLDELDGQVWPGLRRSESLFRQEAALRGLPVKKYRRRQAKLFLALVRRVRETTPALTWADHGSLAAVVDY